MYTHIRKYLSFIFLEHTGFDLYDYMVQNSIEIKRELAPSALTSNVCNGTLDTAEGSGLKWALELSGWLVVMAVDLFFRDKDVAAWILLFHCGINGWILVFLQPKHFFFF